jgi:double-stranded uracil-DNA glycosylase
MAKQLRHSTATGYIGESMNSIYSFPPVENALAERLILGSMPGKASLSAQQYYAHPQNLFWSFMSAIFALPESLTYEQRCAAIVENRIALWDVLKVCTRSGSLDSGIDESSIVANDFRAFLSSHPKIKYLYFNGAKAEAIYMRYVQPHLPLHQAEIQTLRLPSTSPANASIPLSVKREQWQAITYNV